MKRLCKTWIIAAMALIYQEGACSEWCVWDGGTHRWLSCCCELRSLPPQESNLGSPGQKGIVYSVLLNGYTCLNYRTPVFNILLGYSFCYHQLGFIYCLIKSMKCPGKCLCLFIPRFLSHKSRTSHCKWRGTQCPKCIKANMKKEKVADSYFMRIVQTLISDTPFEWNKTSGVVL